jgi:hypothetical protein
VQMWHEVSPVAVQMWQGVRPEGASPVAVQMWKGASPVLVQVRLALSEVYLPAVFDVHGTMGHDPLHWYVPSRTTQPHRDWAHPCHICTGTVSQHTQAALTNASAPRRTAPCARWTFRRS